MATQPDRTIPIFSQPEPTEDPHIFKIHHPSDDPIYKEIDELKKEGLIHPLPFPAPRGGTKANLTLLDVLGGNADAIKTITDVHKQIVFHALGDCGSTRGPSTQNRVTDKLVRDFNESDKAEIPQFNLLLGDIVYSFGEAQYYYDQFYEPYRDYPAPILAAAGNHDGVVAPHGTTASLAAFLRNFCANPAHGFGVSPDAAGLTRTAQIQPGVFFTFEAPFVRIIVLYSNALEDPGVIADGPGDPPTLGTSQLDFLASALKKVQTDRFKGAVLFAHHHPPFTPPHKGSLHGGSPDMLAQMDKVCADTGVWPHAVLCRHVHNYQRFTRVRKEDGTQIPYVSCGNGGHNVTHLSRKGNPAPRTPQVVPPGKTLKDQVIFENYDDQNYGYLRITVTASQLRIEYHSASEESDVKTHDDVVTVDIATRKLTHFNARYLGAQAEADAVREKHKKQAAARKPRTGR